MRTVYVKGLRASIAKGLQERFAVVVGVAVVQRVYENGGGSRSCQKEVAAERFPFKQREWPCAEARRFLDFCLFFLSACGI